MPDNGLSDERDKLPHKRMSIPVYKDHLKAKTADKDMVSAAYGSILNKGCLRLIFFRNIRIRRNWDKTQTMHLDK